MANSRPLATDQSSNNSIQDRMSFKFDTTSNHTSIKAAQKKTIKYNKENKESETSSRLSRNKSKKTISSKKALSTKKQTITPRSSGTNTLQ